MDRIKILRLRAELLRLAAEKAQLAVKIEERMQDVARIKVEEGRLVTAENLVKDELRSLGESVE